MFEEQDLVVKAIEATLGELTGGRGRCDGKAQSRLEQPSGTLPGAGPAVSPGNPETLRPLASCLLPPKPSWSLAERQGPRCAGSLVAGSSIWGGREIGSGTPAPRISWRLGVGWGLSEHPSPYDTARPPPASFLDLLLSLVPGSSPSIGAGLEGRRALRTLGSWGELQGGWGSRELEIGRWPPPNAQRTQVSGSPVWEGRGRKRNPVEQKVKQRRWGGWKQRPYHTCIESRK